MRCSTCGEQLDVSASRCPTCGAGVGAPQGMQAAVPVGRCPRCGYMGEGITYFRRPGHLALLAGFSLFYAIPGLVYYLARRNRNVCPKCGLGWEHAAPTLLRSGPTPEHNQVVTAYPEEPLPRSGVGRRVAGTAMILLAGFLIVMGIVEFEPAAIVVGSLFGASGSAAFWWGYKSLVNRRAALMTGLQRKVLRLATAKGGTLTVTEVASELNLSLQAAEKVMESMDDGFRVRSDVTPHGIIIYEFPEVTHRVQLTPGEPDASANA